MYLTQGLHRAMQRSPQATATLYQGRRRTFQEFGRRVAKLAAALVKLGLRPGDRVAMLSLNSDRYLEYYLAVVWAGGVVNPVNIRWTAPEIVYALKDCEASMLVVDENFRAMAEGFRKDVKSLRHVIYAADGGQAPGDMLPYESLLEEADPIPDACRSGDDLAGVFYTGGTTGFPKGVMLSHASMIASGLSILASGHMPQQPVTLHAAPMFHLADVAVIICQMLTGGTNVIVPAFNPAPVMESIQREKINWVLFVPTMIQMMVDHPARKDYDLSSLELMIYGASPMSEAVLDRAQAALPATKFMQAYGMTELSPIATLLPPYYHTAEGRKQGKVRSAGYATTVTEVKIVDPFGNEAPRGKVGEIAVKGPVVMLGYWNKPAETKAAVRDGWMHSGDAAYMDDEGFVFIVDRVKDMIVSGGENVYCVDVENAIAKHPAVATCAVIGIPHDKWGEAVHAVVVLKPGATATAEAIQAHCRELIAGYKCPSSVEFRESLPLSGAGKVLKTRLREPFWKGKSRRVN